MGMTMEATPQHALKPLPVDADLIAGYLKSRSNEAFGNIVARYSDLVYSACYRVVGENQAAEDATQATFLVLLKRIDTLRPNTVLSGWLHATATRCAMNVRRSAIRRTKHEQVFKEMNTKSDSGVWREVELSIDEALDHLPESQRDAIVLKYFENMSADAAAKKLGCSEPMVRTRLSRGIEKLRLLLNRRGAALTAVALAAMISERSVQAAPPGLSAKITAACIGDGTASAAAAAAAKLALKSGVAAKSIAVALLLACAIVPCVVVAIKSQNAAVVPVAPTRQIILNVGDDFQAAVDAHGENTQFLIKKGVHRLQMVVPKTGDVFNGEDGAVMNGSALLTAFSREGNLWVAANQTQAGQVHGEVQPGYDGARHPEDLFFDDKPLRHVRSRDDVAAGKWFFDYDADKIYFADDPAGHTVEISTARRAFAGSKPSGVVIRHLTIEKYAIPAQMGAIGDQTPAKGWTIEDCELRLNHGRGICVRDDWTVRRCRFHHNGQMAIGGEGSNITLENCEASFNNTLHFNSSWEAGGMKFVDVNNGVFRGNRIEENDGYGLFLDGQCRNITVESNRITNNRGPGIYLVKTTNGTIAGNTSTNNSRNSAGWLWGSQILIRNCNGIDIHHNTVEVAADVGNAIGMIQQNESNSAGEFLPQKNCFVHDNDITHRRSPVGCSGLVADFNEDAVFNAGNRFDSNHYHVTDTNASHWVWHGFKTFDGLRAAGQEEHGTIDKLMPETPRGDSANF